MKSGNCYRGGGTKSKKRGMKALFYCKKLLFRLNFILTGWKARALLPRSQIHPAYNEMKLIRQQEVVRILFLNFS